MLIVEDDCVYEIDEQCIASRTLPKECGIYEAIDRWKLRKRGSDNYNHIKNEQKERAH
jgi:hypothetical protein